MGMQMPLVTPKEEPKQDERNLKVVKEKESKEAEYKPKRDEKAEAK